MRRDVPCVAGFRDVGYPMHWRRFLDRNAFPIDWNPRAPAALAVTNNTLILDDATRLSQDTRDVRHLNHYARLSGTTPEQVSIIFNEFFFGSGSDV
jgi:hypothetical protein